MTETSLEELDTGEKFSTSLGPLIDASQPEKQGTVNSTMQAPRGVADDQIRLHSILVFILLTLQLYANDHELDVTWQGN